MSTQPDTRSFVEYNQSQQRRDDYWERNQTVKETIQKCARALERGKRKHFYYVATKLDDVLIPLLLTSQDKRAKDYSEVLSDAEGWHFRSLRRFVKEGEQYRRAVSGDPEAAGARSIELRGGGYDGGEEAARSCIAKAFQSVAAIAENEEIIREELTTRVDAVGFATKLGEHLQDAEMDIGDPVRVVTEQSGSLKTLFTGGTGQGKSACLEAEAEDYYLRQFNGGKPVKVLDISGFRDGENFFYDIDQQDDDLVTVREEMDMPATFSDDDVADERKIEILVPLTPGLSEENIPFDTEHEDFIFTPFTVPAAEIRKPLLINMITTRLTPEQENIVRDAYDEVDHRQSDWSLNDLAEEIRTRDELNANKKKPAIRTLRQLQNEGFVRTKADEHTIDWREIFEDTETVTVVSKAFMGDMISKLIAFGYVLESVVHARESMHDVPQVAVVMRELWKVAPHNQRQEFDSRAAALQEAIGQMFTQMFRENRHSGIHVLADTQYPSDLLKSVRETFNRYVVFDVNRDTAKDIFEWTTNDHWKSFYGTLSPRKGEASVVGQVEPAVEQREIEFIGPIKYAPASHHHRIAEVDTTGWHARCKYLESEELRRPVNVDGISWDDEVPAKLMIDAGYDEDDDGMPDPHEQPVAAFAARCVRHEPGSAVKKTKVKTAFNEFAHDHDRGGWDFDDKGVQSQFGQRLSSAIDGEYGNTKRDGEVAYGNLELTAVGKEYVDRAMEGLEDAASPIR